MPGARRLNELVDPLTRLARSPAGGQLNPGAAPYLQIFQAKINFIFGDYLQVRELTVYDDGTEVLGPVNIQVAKPWVLRRTPFDGQIYNNFAYAYIDEQTRDATDQSPPRKTERQYTTPSYLINAIIYCARIVRGGCGVSESLRALDLNVDGRAWATDNPV